MLELIQITNIEDTKKILNNFSPERGVWITSDIKSQSFVTQRINQKHPKTSTNNCVKRARDFWYSLVGTIYPNKKVLSRSFLIFLYQEWAKSQKEDWKKNSETGTIVCQYLEILAHLLQHPERDNLIQEWFTTKSSKEPNWKLYHLASQFWDYLEQKNIIESSWLDVYLLDQTQHQKWEWEEMVFDMGGDINNVEIELIRQFSLHKKVKVLVDMIFQNKEWQYISPAYNILSSDLNITSQSLIEPTEKSKIKVQKFSSQLAEVKNIIYEVSTAIKKGIPSHKITVLAPQIEDYWFCLKSYFNKEGIDINKSETVLLSSFPVISLWLAKMWTHLGIIKYENLEIIASNLANNISFHQLRAYFYNADTIQDLPSFLYNQNNLKDKNYTVQAVDFILWALRLYPNTKQDSHIFSAIQDCLNEFVKSVESLQVKLEYQSCLSLLEILFKKREISISKENTKGVNCLSLNAIKWVTSEIVYIAGLSEQNIQNEKSGLISYFDTASIMQDIGFFIKAKPSNSMQRAVSYFIQNNPANIILSCATANFSGTPLNPSSLWLGQNYQLQSDLKKSTSLIQKTKKTSTEHPLDKQTIWDQQQRQPTVKDILQKNNIPSNHYKLIQQSIEEDIGQKEMQPHSVNTLNHLSPTMLSDYINCPFILASKKLFCLKDDPIKDIDRNALERGLLIHKLFEQLKTNIQSKNTTQLLTQDNKALLSDKEILETIDNIITIEESNRNLQKLNSTMLEKERLYLLKKSKKFLQNENNKQQAFSDYKDTYCELKFKCYWDRDKKILINKEIPNAKNLLIEGRIDRVDSNGQSYIVIDYKGTMPTGAVARGWEKAKQFQLSLYIQALEAGGTTLPALPVDIALFLSYKNFNYNGFILKENWPENMSFGNITKRSQSFTTKQQKQEILQSTNQIINSIITQIQEGNFAPNPKSTSICQECQWRKICRAKHLY